MPEDAPSKWAVAQPVTFSGGSDARSFTAAATADAEAAVTVTVWKVNVSFVGSQEPHPPSLPPLAAYSSLPCSSGPSSTQLAAHAALYPAGLGSAGFSESDSQPNVSLWVTAPGTGKASFSAAAGADQACTGISVLTGSLGDRSWATARLAMGSCEGRSWESYEILSPPLLARNALRSNATSLFVTVRLAASDGSTADAVLGVAAVPSPDQIAPEDEPLVLQVTACASPASRDTLGSQPIVAVAAPGQGVSQLVVGGLRGVYAFALA
jgi:hypothetical protein